MNRRLYPVAALLLLAIGLLSFNALNNLVLGSVRLDLTENSLYTVSAGTREIIDGIEEPVDLYFFFSDKSTRDVAQLRTYARRVQELLEEYALRADGRIRLHVVDPAPFSEAEDQAAEFGLQAVPLSAGGENVYFGLAGTNAWGDKQLIPFFQPEREEFLEYELSKLLAGLTTAKKPVVGLIAGLQLGGGFDFVTSRPTPAWAVIEQLQQSVEVRTIQPTAESIDADVTTLMIVHPTGLSEAMQYAVDQFVMKGGKAIVYVDPYCESARAGANPMMDQGPAPVSSNLERLFKAWGVDFAPDKVVGDMGTALMISTAADQAPQPHPGFLGLTADNVDRGDVVTGNLESLNIGMGGMLAAAKGATTRFVPLLWSSARAMPLDSMRVQMTQDPAQLLTDFAPTGQRYTLAARIGGPAASAFAGPRAEGQAYVAKSDDINVIVVADADLLADRFWVQVQDFFGQRIATAWADNAAFAQNAIENLSGSSALIGIRSRGRFSRPFELVQDIRANADAKYRRSAEELQKQLDDTEKQLAAMQEGKASQQQLVLSPEQEQALLHFQDEKLRIRKQLRAVRHQLDQDIEELGTLLKVLNILVLPVLLTLLLFGAHRLREARRRAAGAA